jgi:hypothetical protein
MFDLAAPLRRRDYFVYGLSLAVLKYLGDVAIVWFGAGRLWTPMDYLAAVWSVFPDRRIGGEWTLELLALWTVPFIWAGVLLSVRRAVNAGVTPAVAILFFAPYANYLMMAALCVLPEDSSPDADAGRPPIDEENRSRLIATTIAICAGVAVGVTMVLISVAGLRRYGSTLFFAVPFAMGAATSFIFNRRYPASWAETWAVTLAMLIVSAGTLLVIAAEGFVCLLMAFPLALGMAALGAIVGRGTARGAWVRPGHALMLIVLPMAAAVEPAPEPMLHEVRSAIEIEAPPMAVWEQVVAFPSIPAPTDLVFRSGIAYPTHARIDGAGVGAVRYCEFSTGAFVEPITLWEPGRRLAFDVIASPPPLREWSPYRHVSPPHLDGYLRSRRGEFRLIALPDGRTRLEGSTWYEIDIAPAAYWRMLSDALIRRIHMRVLEHVRAQAER